MSEEIKGLLQAILRRLDEHGAEIKAVREEAHSIGKEMAAKEDVAEIGGNIHPLIDEVRKLKRKVGEVQGKVTQRKTWSFTLDIGKDAQGKRKQKTKGGFKTKKAAEEACTELIELNKGEYVVPSKSTLGEYLQKWINSSAKQTMRDTWIPIRLGSISTSI